MPTHSNTRCGSTLIRNGRREMAPYQHSRWIWTNRPHLVLCIPSRGESEEVCGGGGREA